MGLVVLIHGMDVVPIQPSLKNQILHEILLTFILICNPIFFMISGHFNLHFSGNSRRDYCKFYYKRFVNIVLPLLIYQFIFYCISLVTAGKYTDVFHFIKDFIINVLQDYSSIYFWFMYVLIGFILAAPFLSKLLASLSGDNRRMFAIVLLALPTVSWLLKLVGINLALTSYPFSGWLIYFLLGGLLENKQILKKYQLILILCIVPLINVVMTLTICEPRIKELGLHDLSPFYILLAVAIYQLLLNSSNIKKISESKWVSILARWSFPLYLVHGSVLLVVSKYIRTGVAVVDILVITAITYITSLMLAIILDKIIVHPLQSELFRLKNDY